MLVVIQKIDLLTIRPLHDSDKHYPVEQRIMGDDLWNFCGMVVIKQFC